MHDDLLIGIPTPPKQDDLATTQQLQSFIYKKHTDNMFFDCLSDPDHFKPLIPDSIGGQFEALLFIEKKSLPRNCTPSIAHVVADKSKRPEVWANCKELKIGIIPFTMKNMTTFEQVAGAAVRVVYASDYDYLLRSRLITLLNAAIQANCNIVVLPEYVISPGLQKCIADHLHEMYADNALNVRQLMMVIAGSGWQEGDNNVSLLYDYKGKTLGKYYKYSPFFPTSSPPSLVEHLTERGKICTLVDLPGIGRVLTGICRDVVNEVYTNLLVKCFNPFALFIPAWSPSVNKGFRRQIESLADQYMVSSFLCNCCEALYSTDRPTFPDKCGLVVTPDIHNKSRVRELVRNSKNCLFCEKSGCVYVISLDYSKVNDNAKGQEAGIIQEYSPIYVDISS